MARVQNVDRLIRKLRVFPDRVRDEIAKAMEQSADQIVALAKSLAPIDDGDLQMSISWTWGDPPKGAMVLGQVRSRGAARASGRGSGNLVITVFAGGGDAFYARWVEFGTSGRMNGGIFAGSAHPGTPAQPFFYPAYRATRRSARGRVSRAVNKAAKRVAAGG